MESTFYATNILKKKNIDTYIFVICKELKKNINNILKLLNIDKFPNKLFNNIDLNNNFEKKFYTDEYEIIFYGIDEKKNCDNKSLYETFGKIGKDVDKNKKVLIHLIGNNINHIKNQVISFILGFYHFKEFKSNTETKKDKNKSEIFFYQPKRNLKNNIESFIYEGKIQNEIRDLINTPANILNSETYSQYIKKNINNDIKIKILQDNDLKKLGCNLILGVNQGSKNKAMMIILEYKNLKNKKIDKPIVLVGKGVMFDSGGYNLKTNDFSNMKNDMTGSAIVYAIFQLISNKKIDGHFIGLLPLVENMIGSNAIRPGDILKSYNGSTVEITDTDAEGRLIMADALAYSIKYKPYMCIDIATLTGQAGSIFGNKSSIIMGNNNNFVQKMIKMGIENNEKIWELPMWEEYIELTKSNIADLKNYSKESKAGTIMAGAFLSRFIPDKTIWIHLDIAGVDEIVNETNMRNYGATGEIMRSVFSFLQNI